MNIKVLFDNLTLMLSLQYDMKELKSTSIPHYILKFLYDIEEPISLKMDREKSK